MAPKTVKPLEKIRNERCRGQNHNVSYVLILSVFFTHFVQRFISILLLSASSLETLLERRTTASPSMSIQEAFPASKAVELKSNSKKKKGRRQKAVSCPSWSGSMVEALHSDRVAIQFTALSEPWIKLLSWSPSTTDWERWDSSKLNLVRLTLACTIRGLLRCPFYCSFTSFREQCIPFESHECQHKHSELPILVGE